MVTAAADVAVEASANSKSKFFLSNFHLICQHSWWLNNSCMQLIISLERRHKTKGGCFFSLQQQTLGMTTWSDMNNSGRKVLGVFSEHQQRNESGRVSKLGKIGNLLRGKKKTKVYLRKARCWLTQRYHYYVRLIIPKHLSSTDDHPFSIVSFGTRSSLVFISSKFYSLLWKRTQAMGRPIKSRRSKINILNLSRRFLLPLPFVFSMAQNEKLTEKVYTQIKMDF